MYKRQLGTEAWADYRRTGYPRLFPVVVNNNPDITNLQLGARRMTYPLEEYEANGETIRPPWISGWAVRTKCPPVCGGIAIPGFANL